MVIRPRPAPPYWPAYPEPERSRTEAAYRAAEAEWQREALVMSALNLVLAMCWPLAVVGGIVAWFL